jgi:hypothetical protein
MSVNALETTLWELCNLAERAVEFREAPEALLDRYPLTDDEKAIVRNLDVRELTARQVNPMLIMMTWNTIKGPDHIGEYLSKLNAS